MYIQISQRGKELPQVYVEYLRCLLVTWVQVAFVGFARDTVRTSWFMASSQEYKQHDVELSWGELVQEKYLIICRQGDPRSRY